MTAPPTDLLDTPHLDALWVAVRRGDEQAATDVVLAALDDGADPETVLLDVVGAVQCRVGSEWAANRLSVAEEHTATAINERVVSAVHRWLPRTEPTLGHIVVACVDGEWHALPARLLAEVLRLRGFRVEYLGAQLPAPHLVAHLHRAGRRGDLGVDRHPPSDRARHHHRLPRDGRSDHRRWCRLRVGRSLRPVARSRSVGARRPTPARPPTG